MSDLEKVKYIRWKQLDGPAWNKYGPVLKWMDKSWGPSIIKLGFGLHPKPTSVSKRTQAFSPSYLGLGLHLRPKSTIMGAQTSKTNSSCRHLPMQACNLSFSSSPPARSFGSTSLVGVASGIWSKYNMNGRIMCRGVKKNIKCSLLAFHQTVHVHQSSSRILLASTRTCSPNTHPDQTHY